MKISMDLRFAHLRGGGYVYVQKLIQSLVLAHPEIQWQLYYNPWSRPQTDLIEQAQKDNLAAQDWQLAPVRTGCLSLGQHVEFARFRDHNDIYHYLHFDMPLTMRGPALVMTIHDLYPLTVPDYCSKLKRRYFHQIARANARRSQCIITISQSTRNDILEWLDIPEDRIIVIPQSQADCFGIIEDHELLQNVQLRYNLPAEFILVTGNHKKHKNLIRLAQAYAQLPASLRDRFQLVFTGEIKTETQPLQEEVAQLGLERHVRFLGWTEAKDLPALYNLASLSVLPSLYEGFGLAPLEAMACGTPVAVSNATAIPEVVADVGRKFDPQDVDDMAQAIRMALENDLGDPEMRQRCLDQAAKFSEARTAQATLEVYYKLCGVVHAPQNPLSSTTVP